MRFPLPRIRHDYVSFDALACLHAQTKECLFRDIEIDMKATSWFDADMCAAFGAILYSLEENLNMVNLLHIPQSVERILSKKRFSQPLWARENSRSLGNDHYLSKV